MLKHTFFFVSMFSLPLKDDNKFDSQYLSRVFQLDYCPEKTVLMGYLIFFFNFTSMAECNS